MLFLLAAIIALPSFAPFPSPSPHPIIMIDEQNFTRKNKLTHWFVHRRTYYITIPIGNVLHAPLRFRRRSVP